MTTGRVLTLTRWPVKSMGGEAVAALRVDARGAAGDRTHAVFDTFKGAPRRLTAREAPRLLAWSARYEDAEPDPAAPPLPVVTAPGGTEFGWDGALAAALSDDLGRAVTLRRDEAGQQDLERSLLVTAEATHVELETELDRPLDRRRWRTNVHAELDAAAREEDGWEGRGLEVGDVAFRLLHPCARCVIPTRDPDTQDKDAALLRHLFKHHHGLFGMNARPVGAGVIRVGDPVRVYAGA